MSVVEGEISVLGTGNAGVVLDTVIVKQSDGVLAHREGVFIGDPETTAARLKVTGADPLSTDFGAVVHDPASAANTSLLLSVLTELRVISLLLQDGLNVSDDLDAVRRGAQSDIARRV